MSDNKYQRGKIYRLVCNTTGLQYYGSTIEKSLCERLSKHKYKYKQYFLEKTNYYTSSFEIIQNNNYEIILVELFPCNSKDELHQRERFYIENNKCVNKVIPCRTDAVYRLDNIEKIEEQQKEYYEKNREKVIEYQKTYEKKNVEKIKDYQKQWKLDNKEKMKEYFKDRYREKQRKKLLII